MAIKMKYPIPKLEALPPSFPAEGALNIKIKEGIPVIKSSSKIQNRIERLINRQKRGELSQDEIDQFDYFEQIDDYISLLNRITRNIFLEKENNILYVLTKENTE